MGTGDSRCCLPTGPRNVGLIKASKNMLIMHMCFIPPRVAAFGSHRTDGHTCIVCHCLLSPNDVVLFLELLDKDVLYANMSNLPTVIMSARGKCLETTGVILTYYGS